jgi:flavin reductase (DIM6/NTAB) family NADH-FMN oxidoreductase RutF
MNASHVVVEPHILYLGTPVVLVSTVNEDGSDNLAPISSAFWLGWRGVLGIASDSQTTRNLLRSGECVLNLPSPTEVGAVDRIARTTGKYPVSEFRRDMGYVYEPDKFGRAGMTKLASELSKRPARSNARSNSRRSWRQRMGSARTATSYAARSV